MTRHDDDNRVSTENLILRAAGHEFMSKGFAGARTTSIAEKAGVTHAMLHYYFRTKENLFDRVLSEKMEILKNALLQSVEGPDVSLDTLIRNIIGRHLDFIADNPDLPRFLIGELYSGSDRAIKICEKIHTFAPVIIGVLQTRLDNAAKDGMCRHVDARQLVLDIVSLNLCPYLAMPVVNSVLDDCMADKAGFLSRRKQENYDTIMRKLAP